MKFTARQIWYINAALLVVVLWLVYAIWFAPRRDAWQFIPDNAFLVIESSRMQAALFDNKDSTAELLDEVPFLFDAVLRLDAITRDLHPQKERKPFLENKLISYSVHREAKSNLDYITYLPVKGDERYLRAMLSNNAANKRISNHVTNGVEITRVTSKTDDFVPYSFFLYDDYLISSRSEVLLEAVIAKIKSRSPALDKAPFKESRFQLAHMYFRTRNLLDVADLLPTNLSPNLRSYFRNIVPFNPDLVFNHVEPEAGLITGYIVGNTKIEVPFISAFASQRASPFTSSSWIPENTAFFLRTGFSDAPALGLQLNVYLKQKDAEFYAKKDSVNRLLGKDVDNIFRAISREAVLCEMETVGNENANRVALFHSNQPEALATVMDELAKAAEKYQPFKVQPFSLFNQTIYKIEISELPALLFGSTFSGFSECYYTVRGNYLIIANSQAAMEDYLSKLSLGQTWAASTKHQQLIDSFTKYAQVTAVISPQRIWNNVFYSLPENWQQAVLKHEVRFKNMRLLAVENLVHKDRFASKVHILKGRLGKQRFANQLLLQNAIDLPEPATASPRIVINRQNATEEVVVENATTLTLYNTNREKVNSVPLPEPLTPTNIAMDFYQNGNVQYLLHSLRKVFVMERNRTGLQVEELPVPLTHDIVSVATIPGQIFVADVGGAVYQVFSNKAVKRVPLKKSIGQIADIALARRDNQLVLAIVETDGTLQLFYPNNGVAIKGFPVVATNARPVKLLATYEHGEPAFQILTENGALETVNINGEIEEAAGLQLERRSKNALFGAVFDQQKRDWLITQKDPSGVMIYDKRGNRLLEINTPYYQNLDVKYFDLGNDFRIITIFDGKTTLLYDLRGQQIGDKPLSASASPEVTFEANFNKLLIYNPNDKKLEKWGVKVE